jgi:rod shape-determining protein MreD
VSLLQGLLALALALSVEAMAGRVFPAGLTYVDPLLVAVAYFALRRSQSSAMLVGCAGGLFHDAWFHVDVFGISGFKKTLEGWVVGGLASRVALDHLPGRLGVGVVLSLADQFLDLGLYKMLGLRVAPLDPVLVAARAATTGLLVASLFPIVDRVFGRDTSRAMRRKA